MYELFILCLLMRGSMHGYLMAKIINDMIGPYAKVSNGRLYPLLAKLQQQRLIVAELGEEESKGERQSHPYRITGEGRNRWHKLMMDTTSNPGDYNEIFFQKSCYMEYLKPAERLYIIDHYINYCQAHVLHMMAETEDLRTTVMEQYSLPNLDTIIDAMQHSIDKWQLELTWAFHVREREIAIAEGQAQSASAKEQQATHAAQGLATPQFYFNHSR